MASPNDADFRILLAGNRSTLGTFSGFAFDFDRHLLRLSNVFQAAVCPDHIPSRMITPAING